MKACSYCGRDNNDDARNCLECWTEFSIPPVEKNVERSVNPVSVEPEIDLSGLDLDFEISEGFSRPNWKTIRAYLKSHIPETDWPVTWSLIAKKWLEEMAKDLGGGSGVHESDHFLCLSDLNPEMTRTLVSYADSALKKIRSSLKQAAWTGYDGKHVLLFFSDQDDYFAYISFHYPEGHHALSSGVFLNWGYAHIALPCVDTLSAEHVLVHELVHNLLCHLRIPTWLNEGLAVVIEGQASRRAFLVDRELAERHTSHWNEENIQAFWAGKTFYTPGDDNELSYSLAQILVTLLSEKGGEFITFITNADRHDAGQDAALAILDCDLGEVMAGFLGLGNWRPQRRAIAGYFKKKLA